MISVFSKQEEKNGFDVSHAHCILRILVHFTFLMLRVWLPVGKVAVLVRSLQKLRVRCFFFEVPGVDKAFSSVHVQRFVTFEPFFSTVSRRISVI